MTVVGFVGLGRMGLPMAGNLIRAGFEVVGCDVDPGKAEALAARGGRTAPTPAEVAAASEVSLSMIMDDAVLREVALGRRGVLAGAPRGHAYVDLSTVSPAASAEVAVLAAERGVDYLCGKVAGSIGLAEEAGLTLFASGERAAFERCRPVFAAMAARVHHVGAGESAPT
jgi:2-hydroxy-3-oxopropionate reductase